MNKLLTFRIGTEEFAFPLEQVREVISMQEYTPVPNTSPHFLGYTGLRESVLTLHDLRIWMDVECEITHDTAVVVCDREGVLFGIVVDEIHTVITDLDENVVTINSHSPNSKFVMGMVKRNDKLVLIIDVTKLWSSSDYELINFQNAKETLRNAIKEVDAA